VSARDLVGLRLQAGGYAYRSADAMLYALSLGAGDEPLDTRQLRYVYAPQLSTLPSLPLVPGWPGIWMPMAGRAFDHPRMLHAEERLQLHRRLPPAGIVRAETYVDAIVDRDADRGAFVHTRKELYSENDGLHLATVRSCVLARGDGGCGSGGQPPAALGATPDRAPDLIATRRTLPQQALLYRLNGDSYPFTARRRWRPWPASIARCCTAVAPWAWRCAKCSRAASTTTLIGSSASARASPPRSSRAKPCA